MYCESSSLSVNNDFTHWFNNVRQLIDQLYLDLTYGRHVNHEYFIEDIVMSLKRMVSYRYALEEGGCETFIPYTPNRKLRAEDEYANARKMLVQLYIDCLEEDRVDDDDDREVAANLTICYIVGHVRNIVSILLNRTDDIDHCFDEIIALKNRRRVGV
jgi:hypothetical protein